MNLLLLRGGTLDIKRISCNSDPASETFEHTTSPYVLSIYPTLGISLYLLKVNALLLQEPRQAEDIDEKGFASPGGSVRPGTQCKES